MHNEAPLYTTWRDWFFNILLFNYFCLDLDVLPDHHWFVNCPVTTIYLCWLRYSPSSDKEDYFVCLFAVTPLLAVVWVLSLSIPHGIHIMVPTHPYFFWVVCHLSRTLPPKEPE